jgi:hypothetical protein
VFPDSNHFLCYYHYRKDLKDYFKNLGFSKKKDNDKYNKSKEIISLLGLLPLNYNGDIKYFDNFINNIKAKYNIFDSILNNYFIKYKRKYFLSGEYNYNKLPPDC